MTSNIFALKGELNGKIVVVRFFFCRVYILAHLLNACKMKFKSGILQLVPSWEDRVLKPAQGISPIILVISEHKSSFQSKVSLNESD